MFLLKSWFKKEKFFFKLAKENGIEYNQGVELAAGLFPDVSSNLPQRKLEDLSETLQSGDIVLFSGSHTSSQIIRFITQSAYSHVGMIVRVNNTIALWQSTLDAFPNLLLPSPTPGVQLNDLTSTLQSYVKKYPGTVIVIRKLTAKITAYSEESMQRLVVELNGLPYANLPWKYFVGSLGCQIQKDTWFCSDLVAETLRFMHVLSLKSGPPSAHWRPKDFSSERKTPISFRDGLQFGEEFILEIPQEDAQLISKDEL